ncbi:DUF2085 domain-containing protein [[Clostridium] colinum]|uniref:DUF2085 domain-containing protein n=1 Tax=[Clostridium] colinum TaxID=36835 RepID=UPI002024E4D6|nr:DUF2085 domain-containing protein [[Clostridium] colinum]
MYSKIEKFLKILFMCHCMPDRSFFYKGKQFPICARCTGQLIGVIVGIIFIVKLKDIKGIYIILLTMPLILDGFIQLLTNYESNNIKRVITGFLLGIVIIAILVKLHFFAVKIAFEMVEKIQPSNAIIEKYEHIVN